MNESKSGLRGGLNRGLTLILACGLALVSCTGGSGQDNSATTSQEPEAPTETTSQDTADSVPDEQVNEATGGELIAALPSFGGEETLDPVLSGGATSPIVMPPMYDYLTMLDSEGRIVPGVATEWEANDDGTEFTFFLRDDVTFHNGEPLTASDVAFSVQRHLDTEDARAFYSPSMRNFLEEIDVVDDTTITFRTSAPMPEYALMFGPTYGSFEIVPEDYFNEVGVDGFRAAPIGSGPFELVDYRPGTHIMFEAVDDHPFRALPGFERLTLLAIPEESTRVAMLSAGEAHIAPITPDRVSTVEETAGLEVRQVDQALQLGVHFMMSWVDPSHPTADRRVKLALAHAVDAQTIIDTVYRGFGTPSMPIGAFAAQYWVDPSLEALQHVPFDQARAAELLAEAGYPDGFPIELVVSVGDALAPQQPELGRIVADYWAQIGIDVQLTEMEQGEYRGTYRAGAEGESDRLANVATIWRLPPFLDLDFFCGSGAGYFRLFGPAPFMRDEQVDELCAEAVATQDEAPRIELIEEAFQVMWDEYAHNGFGIAYVPTLYAVNSDVVGDWTLVENYASGLGLVYSTIQPAS